MPLTSTINSRCTGVWFCIEMLIRCTAVCRSFNSIQECLLSMLMIFIDAAVHQCTQTHTVAFCTTLIFLLFFLFLCGLNALIYPQKLFFRLSIFKTKNICLY